MHAPSIGFNTRWLGRKAALATVAVWLGTQLLSQMTRVQSLHGARISTETKCKRHLCAAPCWLMLKNSRWSKSGALHTVPLIAHVSLWDIEFHTLQFIFKMQHCNKFVPERTGPVNLCQLCLALN